MIVAADRGKCEGEREDGCAWGDPHEDESFRHRAWLRAWNRTATTGRRDDMRRDRDDEVRVLARLGVETKQGSDKWQVAENRYLLHVADVPALDESPDDQGLPFAQIDPCLRLARGDLRIVARREPSYRRNLRVDTSVDAVNTGDARQNLEVDADIDVLDL